ncbi:MAG: hypothetical protein WBL93_07750 [Lutisporaceae bacterium]
MKYLDFFMDEKNSIQNKIELLLQKYRVQPVGTGYIDLILTNDIFENFVHELTAINVIISNVSWWCHCTKISEKELGCPHGMGGPISKYCGGWFSETQIPMFEVGFKQNLNELDMDFISDEVKQINSDFIKYIKNDFVKSIHYSKCLMPGLWLYVPDEWNRIWYMIG